MITHFWHVPLSTFLALGLFQSRIASVLPFLTNMTLPSCPPEDLKVETLIRAENCEIRV